MEYRILRRGEKIKKGDQYYSPSTHQWVTSGNWPGNQASYKYRRPLKSVESRKPIVNTGYTAALRKHLRDCGGFTQMELDRCIKRILRLNAKHYA